MVWSTPPVDVCSAGVHLRLSGSKRYNQCQWGAKKVSSAKLRKPQIFQQSFKICFFGAIENPNYEEKLNGSI